MFLSICVHSDYKQKISALTAILIFSQILIDRKEAAAKEIYSVENPHGNVRLCSSCHISNQGGQDTLKFDGNISQLCHSCHDGKFAKREIHPVDIIPSKDSTKNIPSDFPLVQGRFTCLTCHDVSLQCTVKQSVNTQNSFFLRQDSPSRPLDFCLLCHNQEYYKPFNVHDQLEEGKTKPETCIWCHTKVPDTNNNINELTDYELRGNSYSICGNCHIASAKNPANESHTHMQNIPSQEMKWYMSAYEIQLKMRLPLEELISYVQAANRIPRSIPFDESGSIVCWSCHNPHEKGLLSVGNPRSIGAESEKAQNHRLRTREGDISCRICHEK